MSKVIGIAEHRQGSLRDVSFELVTAGSSLAAALGREFELVIIGNNTMEMVESVNCDGVDRITVIEEGEGYNHDIYVECLQQMVDTVEPRYLLVPHTATGLDFVPPIAAKTGYPIMTDVLGLEYDGSLSIERGFFGGKIQGEIRSTAERLAITIRPGEWPAAEGTGDAIIREFEFSIDESAIDSTVRGFHEIAGGDIDISEAQFLISIGRGIEEEENLALIEELVECLDATLAASRPIVDKGWLPKHRQVGQSGKTVAPEVYIAIGISGAIQHISGMKDAKTIIAINEDPDAPIFDVADYGIVGDLFDVVPELIDHVS